MGDREDARLRTAELERRVADLEAERRVAAAADAVVERALTMRTDLAATVEELFALLVELPGTRGAGLYTLDEELVFRAYRTDGFPWSEEELERAASESLEPHAWVSRSSGALVIGQPLDVAGEPFGLAALVVDPALTDDRVDHLARCLLAWCEELDNHLASIAQARVKHRVASAVAAALREPVLDRGIDRALEVLSQHVDFDDLALIYRREHGHEPVHYRVVKAGRRVHDERDEVETSTGRLLRRDGLLEGAGPRLANALGMSAFIEEMLIHGVQDAQLLGRVLVGRRSGGFHSYDRDLFESFASGLCQRILDFHRQWKSLSLCFASPVVERLLGDPEYETKYLAPRERRVAVMYCDISGFTRISEQVLREPALITRLIDLWSAEAVRIVWETGGVFDKMVGDCIIGLWGPPFDDWEGRRACAGAAEAAERIRDFTRRLSTHAELPELRELDPPPGVATGLHYCSLYVGRIGPNEDFTGFGSGMNNAARLQGVAQRDEILCMEAFVRELGELARFGPERSQAVKNVAAPLRFRPLLDPPRGGVARSTDPTT